MTRRARPTRHHAPQRRMRPLDRCCATDHLRRYCLRDRSARAAANREGAPAECFLKMNPFTSHNVVQRNRWPRCAAPPALPTVAASNHRCRSYRSLHLQIHPVRTSATATKDDKPVALTKKNSTKQTHLQVSLQSPAGRESNKPDFAIQSWRTPKQPPVPISFHLNRSHFNGLFLLMRAGSHAPCLIADRFGTFTRHLPTVDSARKPPPGATSVRENAEPGFENRSRPCGVPPYRRHPCLLLVRRPVCRRRSVYRFRNTIAGDHGMILTFPVNNRLILSPGMDWPGDPGYDQGFGPELSSKDKTDVGDVPC